MGMKQILAVAEDHGGWAIDGRGQNRGNRFCFFFYISKLIGFR